MAATYITPLLKRILTGVVVSKFILVEDNIYNDGHHLFHSLVQKICQRIDKVHFFMSDETSQLFIERYEPSLRNNIEVVRLYEDPFGWNEAGGAQYTTDLSEYLDVPVAHTQESSEAPSSSVSPSSMIVFDSLTMMILQLDLSVAAKMLLKLLQKDPNRIMLALIHTDVNEMVDVETIEHITNTVIRLTSADPLMAMVTHKFPAKTLAKELLQFKIAADKLQITEISKVATKTVHQLASSLTFNVSLKDAERRSRAQLVLPYEKRASDENASASSTGGGRVFYEPDEADDFDEEDPDDDLNI